MRRSSTCGRSCWCLREGKEPGFLSLSSVAVGRTIMVLDFLERVTALRKGECTTKHGHEGEGDGNRRRRRGVPHMKYRASAWLA